MNEEMMSEMMPGMMVGMGLFGLLVTITLVLAAAAFIKFLFFNNHG